MNSSLSLDNPQASYNHSTHQLLLDNQSQIHEEGSVLTQNLESNQSISSAAPIDLNQPSQESRNAVARLLSYQPSRCFKWWFGWYCYFLSIGIYFYCKVLYETIQDHQGIQGKDGIFAVDIMFCIYPMIFVIFEIYAIRTANKKAAIIAIWGFLSHLVLYFIYTLVIYFWLARDESKKESIINDGELWIGISAGATMSGCFCVYKEICRYHKIKDAAMQQMGNSNSVDTNA